MNNEVNSIYITGVGGQGILLASEVLSNTALSSGFDTKKSEVHGMAQRGGTVVSAVRFGEKVYSPLIPEGEADIILAFEKLEALRQVQFLKPEGMMIVNTQKINPGPVASGEMEYPEGVIDRLRQTEAETHFVDAISLAKEAGHTRSTNVVLLGALSNNVPLEVDAWKDSIKNKVPEKTIDINLKAFDLGKESILQ